MPEMFFSRMYRILLALLLKLLKLLKKFTQHFFHVLVLIVNPLCLPKNIV